MQKIIAKTKIFWGKYAFWLLLATAAVFRLAVLPYAFYGTTGEMYRDLSVMYNWFFQNQWPLLGPSSSLGGFHFGAVYYYLLAPFYALFRYGPTGLVFASAVFSLLEIYLVYHLLLEWFRNKSAALLGTALLVFSLYDIQNAYYVSNPTLLPFFLVLFFYCLTKIMAGGQRSLADGRSSRWVHVLGLATAFGIGAQLHATAMALLCLILAVVIIRRKLVMSIRHYVVSFAVVIFWFLPYLIYEFGHQFSNFRRLFVLGESTYSWLVKPGSLAAIIEFWDRVIIFKNAYYNLAISHPLVYFFLLPWYFAVFVWLFMFLNKRPKTQAFLTAYPAKLLLGLWVGLSMAMFIFYQPIIQPFYFLVLWPAPIILLAWGMWWLWQNNKPLYYYSLIVFVGLQLVQLGFFYPLITYKQYSYGNMKSLFSSIKQDAQGQEYNMINETFDINLFVYYNQLLGKQLGLTRSKAKYLYLIYDPKITEVNMPVPGSEYRVQKIINDNYFKIVKYELRS